MRFEVGSYTCELSLDDHGETVITWWPEAPKYLDAADRQQYRAGREEFLRCAGKAPARLPAGSNWRALRRLGPVLVVAATLTGCARGGGISLEAMIADQQCEQAGYEVGAPQYAACRMELARRADTNAAAMQAFYARQAESARQNQPQRCFYNGSTIGGITNGSVWCP